MTAQINKEIELSFLFSSDPVEVHSANHFTKHRLTLTDWSERLIICSESFHIPLSYDDKLNDSVCLIGRESRLLLVIDIHFHRANNKRNSHKTNNKRGNGILISLSHRYPNREKMRYQSDISSFIIIEVTFQLWRDVVVNKYISFYKWDKERENYWFEI